MVGGDGSPLRLYEVVLKVSEEKEHAPLTSGCSVPPSRPASCAVCVSTSTVTALMRQAEPSGGAAACSALIALATLALALLLALAPLRRVDWREAVEAVEAVGDLGDLGERGGRSRRGRRSRRSRLGSEEGAREDGGLEDGGLEDGGLEEAAWEEARDASDGDLAGDLAGDLGDRAGDGAGDRAADPAGDLGDRVREVLEGEWRENASPEWARRGRRETSGEGVSRCGDPTNPRAAKVS